MRRGIEDRGRSNVDMNPPVPGLAPKPPPPLPTSLASKVAHNTTGSPIPTCPNCALLREVLRQAHEQLVSAQTRINASITLGKEAIERSSVRVSAYEILDRVRRRHGIPFEDGHSLPDEYTKHFPVHKYDDGILRGTKDRAAEVEHTADAEEAMQFQSLERSHSDGDHCAGNPALSSESTEESDESVPPGFSPRSSQRSGNEGSENAWDEDSDDNRDWELDPQALSGSDMGSGYGEYHEEGQEDDESGEEYDEDGIGEDNDEKGQEDDQSGEERNEDGISEDNDEGGQEDEESGEECDEDSISEDNDE